MSQRLRLRSWFCEGGVEGGGVREIAGTALDSAHDAEEVAAVYFMTSAVYSFSSRARVRAGNLRASRSCGRMAAMMGLEASR